MENGPAPLVTLIKECLPVAMGTVTRTHLARSNLLGPP